MISKSTALAILIISTAIGFIVANQYYMREAMYAEDLVIPDNHICIKNKWEDHLIICSEKTPFSLWSITPRTGRLAAEGES
tara:strand:+ start:418 stop:660 length:243 start_codon:yes stop_codon:yes gene_type:complete